jgi:thiosulfate/3-mercaptopyruvate sulfurtransferase
MNAPLISVDDLNARLRAPDLVVVDCRFDLAATHWGHEAYLDGHVPGAVYAHLDRDLSGPPLTDRGRHPLPGSDALFACFGRMGIGAHAQVVAYDQADGAVASRLWWLLRYVGHDEVAVLDGGWRAWSERGLPAESGEHLREPSVFTGTPRRDWLVTVDEVSGAARLVDARAGERYRGEKEPLDPVAGHIPGARNHPYRRNVDDSGRFLPAEAVRDQLLETLDGIDPGAAVYYCGSGVTACHLLLAAAHAGLAPGRLYAGSWSDWCSDPARPVATGSD